MEALAKDVEFLWLIIAIDCNGLKDDDDLPTIAQTQPERLRTAVQFGYVPRRTLITSVTIGDLLPFCVSTREEARERVLAGGATLLTEWSA